MNYSALKHDMSLLSFQQTLKIYKKKAETKNKNKSHSPVVFIVQSGALTDNLCQLLSKPKHKNKTCTNSQTLHLNGKQVQKKR